VSRSKEVYTWLKQHPSSTSKDTSIALHISQNRAGEYLRTLTDYNHATRDKIKGQFYYTATPETEPSVELKAEYDLSELPAWVQQNFPRNHTTLEPPTPSVVFVYIPSEPKSGTIEQIVPSMDTIAPIVSSPTVNGVLHGHDNGHGDTAYDLALSTVQRENGGGPWSEDYIIERMETVLDDPANAKGYFALFKQEGLVFQTPDSYWQVTKGKIGSDEPATGYGQVSHERIGVEGPVRCLKCRTAYDTPLARETAYRNGEDPCYRLPNGEASSQ
jgi:hypothetical protein